MEILGIALAFLGLILAYIWKSNGHMQRMMMEALDQIEESQKEIAAGQKEMAKLITEGLKYLADLVVAQGKRSASQI